MIKRGTWIIFLFIMIQGMVLTGCGLQKASDLEQSQSKSSEFHSVVDGYIPPSPSPEPIAKDEADEIKSSRDAVITVGVISDGLTGTVRTTATKFNISQDKYWVDVHRYNKSSEMMLDITRKQGPDIFYIGNFDYYSFAQKGVFEELTPYFEKSEVVNKEDIVEAVWREGCVDEGMYFVIPQFQPLALIVEKGYTHDGAWTTDEYLALAEKYPVGMLSNKITEPVNLLLNDLSLSLDSYINWEEQTCSFDSESFIRLLEQLKALKNKKYESLLEYTVAEQLQHNKLLTEMIFLRKSPDMNDYKDIRDALMDFCDLAGMPNEDGQLKYGMDYDELYGISAGSKNKEAAWSFLEYILSEEYQLKEYGGKRSNGDFFSARRDLLEKSLDEQITEFQDIHTYHTNRYTREEVKGIAEFTEADKQVILNIIDNCYCSKAASGGEIFYIISEEVNYFFQGSKTAEEVAKVIQNRITLYLIE